jgi:RNA-directed DNA polymerase
MNLATPSSVQKLQKALHDKAKESPGFRFYALYDKVYRKDVLAFAYQCCKANGGAAGVDGQTFEDIKEYGVERWLDELAQELRSQTYRPLPVRRVYIPKPDGKQRPLGVPAIRDRTAETAAVLVLEPIFEADLGGPTISTWVLSAKPTGRWNNTPGKGYDSGCVPSTKCAGRQRSSFPKPTYTTCGA